VDLSHLREVCKLCYNKPVLEKNGIFKAKSNWVVIYCLLSNDTDTVLK